MLRSSSSPVTLRRMAIALAASASVWAGGPRLIVPFRDDDVEAAFSPVTRVAHLARESGVEGRHLRRMASGAHLVERAGREVAGRHADRCQRRAQVVSQ